MWPDATITRELLMTAREGSPEAINALMDRHRVALRSMIDMRLDRGIGQRVDASDLVQEVLFEASRRLKTYLKDPKLPFHLWLRHLAKDQLIDTQRRHRGAQRRSLNREQPLSYGDNNESQAHHGSPLIADGELTPAAALLEKEFAAKFRQAVDQLEETDREIVLMRHFEHLSNTEVAQALGLSQPAAGMRHLRALRRLKEILGDVLPPLA